MKPTLLATKFFLPAVPAQHVQRPQLSTLLNAGLEAGRVLTLISAPAGFGKSTCASEWARGLGMPVAWLSLEPSDDDPARFFTYFVAALQKVDENLGRSTENLFENGQLPAADTLSTALIHDLLATPERFVLVLDDFQVIQEGSILALLGKLLNSRPPHLHLVLVTREDPLLPLARLRASNQVTDIRAADLRFTSGEAGSFLNDVMDLHLSEQDIEALENRTEGWAAGLQLAGLSMRGRGNLSSYIAGLSGSNRYILSYLTEEVLSRQSEETQRFLLQTSILEALNGELCDAVTGQVGSRELLEHLYNANLFLIPLDDEQNWYRYHHLFADLLRSQQSQLAKEQLAELHLRAGQWYEAAGMASQAIEHTLSAGDYPHAVALLEQYAMNVLVQGYAKTVEGWMQAVPPEWHVRSPKVNLAFAWMHLLRGNYPKVSFYLQQAGQAIESSGQPADSLLRAEWLALQANLLNVQGKPAESIQSAMQALQMTPPDNGFILSLAYMGLGGAYRIAGNYDKLVDAYQQAIANSRRANNTLAEIMSVSALTLMAYQYGQLHMAYDTGSQAIDRLEREGKMPVPVAGTILGGLGMIHYEWNQLEQAYGFFKRSEQLSALSGHNAGLVYNHLLIGRWQMAKGDLEGAAKSTQQAADLLSLGVPAWLAPEVPAQQVRVYLAQNNPASAQTVLMRAGVLDENGAPLPQQPGPGQALLQLANLRWVLYRAREMGRAEELTGGLEQAGSLIDGAARARRNGILLPAQVLRALLHAADGDYPSALADLERALEIGEPEGFTRSFTDEGAAMVALLRKVLERGTRPAYVRKLLEAFPAEVQAQAVTAPAAQGLLEPLTEREREVLALIAEGLKYEEIAARLVITVNTVRFYVKEIYGKLGVNNRTQAVAVGREQGLLA